MKLIMLPLVFSVAFVAFENRDKIMDQYNAAYPSDPAKEVALQECISRDKYFNRLDGDDRQACYRKYMPPTPISVTPSPSPSYAYSPSSLPGSDIRRQEANDSYRPPVVIPSAQDEQPPAPRHAVAAHTQRHAAIAHRVAAPQPQ
jgi:hypothetical protein